MRRREIVAVLACAVAVPSLALAQDQPKVARVGYLGTAPAASFLPRLEALRAGLRDLGYFEGKNLKFEFRWAEEPRQLPDLAAELLQAGVDVIFVPTSIETAAALQATRVVPVVFGGHADPVGVGHVTSLAHPGGNATGMAMLLTDLVAKRLEALKEALPGATRFGVLFTPAAPSYVPALEASEKAARTLGIELLLAPVRGDHDFETVFAEMEQDGSHGVMVLATPLMLVNRVPIADLAIRHRLPTVFGVKENVAAGGLMSYAPDANEAVRRAATYIDKILKGTKPADLPVEQASRYQFVINLKTARALGLTIPPTLLARADEVIE